MSEAGGRVETPAGRVMDALEVDLVLGEGQQVTECIVIGKVADFSEDAHGTALVVGSSKGLDWIAQRGLLSAGMWALDTGGCTCDHDDDDDD